MVMIIWKSNDPISFQKEKLQLTHQILNFQKEKFDSPNFELAVHVARIVDKGRSHYVHLPHHL